MNIPVLFIPSFHGDIRLERISDEETRIIVAKATPLEQNALRELVSYAFKKNWIDSIDKAVFDEGSFIVNADILKVQKPLAKFLKPGREVVTVVRFNNGKMEEIAEAELKNKEPTPVEVSHVPEKPAKAPEPKPEPQAAAAVAKPWRGCPPPEFAQAELRANRVLETFLDPEQKADFRAHNCFVTIGGATGHRYMVTSRHMKGKLAVYGGRSFYDLDDQVALCVHDWEVAPAEEMLAIHLLASLPQYEMYLRRLEDEAV